MIMRERFLVLFAAAWLVVACGDDDANDVLDAGGEGGTPEAENVTNISGSAVLTERAVVLDEAALSQLSELQASDEQVDLTFAGSSERLDEVDVGDVLILGPTELTPNGALLEVESIAQDGAEIALVTRPAELGAAFEALSIQLDATLAKPSDIRGASSSPLTRQDVAVSRQALGLAFPFSFSGEGDNQSELRGSLALDSSFGLELDFSFEDGLSELSRRRDAAATFNAERPSRARRRSRKRSSSAGRSSPITFSPA